MKRFPLAALPLLALAIAACAPGDRVAGEAPVRGHDSLSVSPDLFGINIDPQNPAANPARADLDAVGARRVRIELKVPAASGSADDELAAGFAIYDPIIAQRIGAGIGVLLVLDYQTLGQDRAGAWDGASFRAAFAGRAGAIAAHYAPLGVDDFEIWNEEDLCTPGYCPGVDAVPFAALLGEAAVAIHVANPSAKVALGGLGSGGWEAYLSSVVGAMGEAWGWVDAVGVHPYLHWPEASGIGASLEYIVGRCHDIGNKPLWLTEWGDAGQQAATERAYFSFFASSSAEAQHVEQAYLFAWSDAQHDAPDAFGLFDRGGAKKLAEWTAFHDAALGAEAPPDPPLPAPPAPISCGDLASQQDWNDALCEWNGNGACGGQGPSTGDCDHCCEAGSPPPPPPPANGCACQSGVDNFCLYAPSTTGCDMTAPGGYCDPNGDGGYDDADWVRGYDEYHAACP